MQNICRYMSVKYCKDDRGNQYRQVDSGVEQPKTKSITIQELGFNQKKYRITR